MCTREKKLFRHWLSKAFLPLFFFSFLFFSACEKDSAEKTAGESSSKKAGFEIEKHYKEQSVELIVRLAKSKLSLFDTQHLELELRAPQDVAAQWPALFERLSDFRLVPWKESSRERSQDGTQIEIKRFGLEAHESGQQLVPPFLVQFSLVDGNKGVIKKSLKSEALFYEIVLPENSAEVTKDPAPPLGVQALPSFSQSAEFWLWLLAGFLLLVGAIVFFALRKKREKIKEKAKETLFESALKKLQQLVEEQQAGQLNNTAFVAAVANLLRWYIEGRFEIRASEQTTQEFIRDLTQPNSPLAKERNQLKAFMEFVDLVKFAGQNASSEELKQGFDLVHDLIHSTKQKEEVSLESGRFRS